MKWLRSKHRQQGSGRGPGHCGLAAELMPCLFTHLMRVSDLQVHHQTRAAAVVLGPNCRFHCPKRQREHALQGPCPFATCSPLIL